MSGGGGGPAPMTETPDHTLARPRIRPGMTFSVPSFHASVNDSIHSAPVDGKLAFTSSASPPKASSK
eukprot:5062056-Prymnesium_polylepis.1